MKNYIIVSISLFAFYCADAHAMNTPAVPVFYVQDYGAKCQLGTDDTAAFVRAGNAALATTPHGIVLMGGTVCSVGTTGNVNLPGVTYMGDVTAYGYNSNFSTAPYTLLLNPSYTINMASGGNLTGIRVFPQGMGQQSSTLRGVLSQIAAFSGTAITISGVQDVSLSHVMVNGFATAISHVNSDRVHYDHVEGDDTNFLSVNGCGDTCTANQLEAWPFMASPYAMTYQTETTAISAFRSGPGGLVEVALASIPKTPIVTGDMVIIGSTAHAYQFPNGRHTVTAIDNQHFTLNGTTYTSASATNEVAFLTASIRKGPAFNVSNTGMVMTALTDYGHDISYEYGANTDGMQCLGCWADGDSSGGTYADPVPVGLLNGAPIGSPAVLTQHNSFNGGKIYNKAYAIVNNSTSARPLTVSNVALIQDTGVYANLAGAGVNVQSGSVLVSNSSFEGSGTGAIFYVADAATLLRLDGVKTEGGVTSYQTSSTDCPKLINNGQIFCSWTPVVTGGLTAGTWTPATNGVVGNYSMIGNQVTVWGHVSGGLSGATGNTIITGLPLAATTTTNDNGTCAIGRAANVALDSGFTQIAADIVYGQSQISFNELGSNKAATAVPVGNLGPSFELEFTCHYHN